MDKDFLSNVYGYSDIKEELFIIRDWYLNNENSKRQLPKGIIFYGNPGCGKTHFIREYSKSFGFPVFVMEGKDDNILKEICKIYKDAKKEKKAIVVIDELDRLVEKDIKLERVLMSELDGFDNTNNILTLATCNNYDDLPEALIRDGRFDRHFYVNSKGKEMEEVIRGFALDNELKLSEDDVLELSDLFEYLTAGEIKSVFSNASLRFGENATINDIINTSDFLKTGFIKKNDDFIVHRYVAIHEVGHALYSYLFCKTKKFLRIFFNNDGGAAVCKDISGQTKESRIDDVRVGLAGIVAEDIVNKGHDVGCAMDLERVYDLAFRLVNKTCINGIKNICVGRWPYNDIASEKEKDSFDKKTIAFIKKNYKIVKKRLKKYKNKIIEIAKYLEEKKEIKRNDFISLVEK